MNASSTFVCPTFDFSSESDEDDYSGDEKRPQSSAYFTPRGRLSNSKVLQRRRSSIWKDGDGEARPIYQTTSTPLGNVTFNQSINFSSFVSSVLCDNDHDHTLTDMVDAGLNRAAPAPSSHGGITQPSTATTSTQSGARTFKSKIPIRIKINQTTPKPAERVLGGLPPSAPPQVNRKVRRAEANAYTAATTPAPTPTPAQVKKPLKRIGSQVKLTSTKKRATAFIPFSFEKREKEKNERKKELVAHQACHILGHCLKL